MPLGQNWTFSTKKKMAIEAAVIKLLYFFWLILFRGYFTKALQRNSAHSTELVITMSGFAALLIR